MKELLELTDFDKVRHSLNYFHSPCYFVHPHILFLSSQRTALYSAIRFQQTEMLKFLISMKCKLEFPFNIGLFIQSYFHQCRSQCECKRYSETVASARCCRRAFWWRCSTTSWERSWPLRCRYYKECWKLFFYSHFVLVFNQFKQTPLAYAADKVSDFLKRWGIQLDWCFVRMRMKLPRCCWIISLWEVHLQLVSLLPIQVLSQKDAKYNIDSTGILWEDELGQSPLGLVILIVDV